MEGNNYRIYHAVARQANDHCLEWDPSLCDFIKEDLLPSSAEAFANSSATIVSPKTLIDDRIWCTNYFEGGFVTSFW